MKITKEAIETARMTVDILKKSYRNLEEEIYCTKKELYDTRKEMESKRNRFYKTYRSMLAICCEDLEKDLEELRREHMLVSSNIVTLENMIEEATQMRG